MHTQTVPTWKKKLANRFRTEIVGMQAVRGGGLSGGPGPAGRHETTAPLSRGKNQPKKLQGFEVNLLVLQVFQVSPGCVELNPAFRDYEERSNKVDEVLKQLRAENAFIALKGWRDEVHCLSINA